MPYVEGESLRGRLEREKQLSLEHALLIASEVADALHYAHGHAVVHRDIKPENILLSSGHALVADFGIARAIARAGGEPLTATGLAVGTPTYMSPEQAAGEPQVDGRSDVYSLGCVLYEMLAGLPPYTGSTAQVIFAKRATEPVPSVRRSRGDVPLAVDATLRKALAPSPSDRFPTAGQFAAALVVPVGRTAPASQRRRVAVTMLVGGAVGLAAIAFVWHPWRRTAKAAAVGADVPSVAVLPFANLTGHPTDQYLSDGMTEEVIGQLARVRGLKIISRTSAEALKGAHLTLRQIADTLGVRNVLEGSVRRAGNRIRVDVDLIDATTDAHVWATTYNRNLTDVFTVQEEIARHVADSLVSTVGIRPPMARIARTAHSGAYEAYLTARTLLYRRSPEALRGALDQFRRAIEEDSAYAPAYAGVASAYTLWAIYAYRGIDFYAGYGRALAMADRAIALDSNLAEAHAARGYLMTRTWGPAEEISVDFRRALELRPSSADVHAWYARFLSREDRHTEALAEGEQAVSLDPLAPGARVTLSVDALIGRRYDLAEQEAARAVALEPRLTLPRALQALADLLSGNPTRCVTRKLGPYIGVRAMCLYSLGRVQEAARLADSLRAAVEARTLGDSIYSPVLAARGLAEYYAWTGKADESLAWLERAYAISPEGELFAGLSSEIYDKVRKDRRFQSGVERLHAVIYDRVQRASLGVGLK
jgi:serine/threonine-protein kinase